MGTQIDTCMPKLVQHYSQEPEDGNNLGVYQQMDGETKIQAYNGKLISLKNK